MLQYMVVMTAMSWKDACGEKIAANIMFGP
jgi:hypothetical protein